MRGGIVRVVAGTAPEAARYLDRGLFPIRRYRWEHGTIRFVGFMDESEFELWCDWQDPDTGEIWGKFRTFRSVTNRRSSPRFMGLVMNSSKTLSVAADMFPEVAQELTLAHERAALKVVQAFIERSSVRVVEGGIQVGKPFDHVEFLTANNTISEALDPYWHTHILISPRVFALGKWRGLNNFEAFRKIREIHEAAENSLATDLPLIEVLKVHELVFEPASGSIPELEELSEGFSTRRQEILGHVARRKELLHPNFSSTFDSKTEAKLATLAWTKTRSKANHSKSTIGGKP